MIFSVVWYVVADELVGFEKSPTVDVYLDFRKITHQFRGVAGIYLENILSRTTERCQLGTSWACEITMLNMIFSVVWCVVADELVGFEKSPPVEVHLDFRKITHHFRGVAGIYLENI